MPSRSRRAFSFAAPHALLAAVSYVPLLLTQPGEVGADTKQYLYLDPGRLLRRAVSMWDAHIGMGTVTHQTIGYLFPMGPFYWLFDRLGAPDWVAQRIWLATILLAAGAGVLFLLRTLHVGEPGRTVAALAYALSPYSLHYAARISVILLPWAGLPWMVALVVRGLRRGGWRHPALFAIVVALVGGVNATALVYAGLAPVLWFPFAVWVLHEATWRRAAATFLRTGALTLLTSLWWIVGLAVQSGYGLPILKFTETVEAVAKTSLSSESLRGLGYWFFYGRDKLGPWIEPGVQYTQHVWLISVGFALVALAFAAAAVARWRHRAYFVVVLLVGVTFAVGAYPYAHPSPLGRLFEAAARGSTAGLAMRSTGRAVPLVVLALAVLLGVGVTRAFGTRRRTGAALAVVAVALVALDLPALWTGTVVAKNLERPEHIPAYWLDATRWLDRRSHDTRVLEVPGSDFAAYRWGNTVDPITPGLMDRPYVARELIPWGSAPSADLLDALDRRLQEGVLEPQAIAPVARLLSVGDVVLRADLQFERYNTARPRPTWQLLTSPRPAGLEAPVSFGAPRRNTPSVFPMVDEIALALPAGAPDPPPVAAFPVPGARPIVRAEPVSAPLLLAGDGEGVVDAAAAGLLDGGRTVLYAASHAQVPADAQLVLTDTNRRRAQRWSTVRENTGYTEQAGEKPLVRDPGDARLAVFPHATDEDATVMQQRGVRSVRATHYGNPVSYTPEDRAAFAFDGDPLTAWRVGAFGDPAGERLRVELAHPVTLDHLTVLQPVNGPRNRYVTRATLTFDGGRPLSVALGPESRELPGQEVRFARRTFSTVEYRVDATNVGTRASYIGYSAVGLAELRVGDERVDEVVRLPRDLPVDAGRALTVLLTRARSDPVPPRTDEEPAMSRLLTLPVARTFSVGGTARLSASVPDDVIDSVVGESGLVVRASAHLPGDLRARASAALDGDPTTAWVTNLGPQEGQWLELDPPRPITVDRLDLRIVADGRHSVPTLLRLENERGETRVVPVPRIVDGPKENATSEAPVRFVPLTGARIRVTVAAAREVRTLDYYSEQPIALPIGIAELGALSPAGLHGPASGARVTPPSGPLPGGCRTDLLTVDGAPVPIVVAGDAALADGRVPLTVAGCGPPLTLGPGDHVVRTRLGRDTGIDLDRLVLSSPGRAPAPPPADLHGPAPPPAVPRVRVRRQTPTALSLRVSGAAAPFRLVLGESWNKGWTARVRGGPSLGRPALVDGYANGWIVQPLPGRVLDIELRWTPQRHVWAALAVSAAGLVLCLLLALFGSRRRRDATASWRKSDEDTGENTGRSAGLPARIAAPLVAGGVASAVAGVPTGLLVGALTALVMVTRRARPLLLAGSVGAVALAGAYTAIQQYRYRYPPEFEWPTFFHRAHVLGWVAVTLLAADVLLELVGPRRRGPTASPGPSPPT